MATINSITGNSVAHPVNNVSLLSYNDNDSLNGETVSDTPAKWYGNNSIDEWYGDSVNGELGSVSAFSYINNTTNTTSGNDVIYGTPEIDSIFADAGHDKVYAKAGDDYVDGWTGNDKLYGQDGNDTLLGYDGKDYLNGGYGNDTLYGEYGKDTLVGDTGADRLIGGPGKDKLTGGTDADTFVFYSPWEGIDKITDFTWQEGDKIEVSAGGFGIGQTDFHRFTYDNNTGALYFDQTQFASLQPNLNPSNGTQGFISQEDITIV